MKTLKSLLFSLLLMASLAGCYSGPALNSTYEASVSQNGIAKTSVSLPEYRLGFGDVVEIKFFNNERFNETVAVRPDGRITLEKMGDIAVTGMTPLHLDSLITAKYAGFVRDPEVTVFVRQFGGYQIYVLGEVNNPGGFPLQKDMNVFQALATAGGHRETAKLGCVMILRRDEKNGVQAFKLDLNRAIKDRDDAGLLVQAQDVIYVPKTVISNVSKFLSQVYDGVLPPLDVYTRALLYKKR